MASNNAFQPTAPLRGAAAERGRYVSLGLNRMKPFAILLLVAGTAVAATEPLPKDGLLEAVQIETFVASLSKDINEYLDRHKFDAAQRACFVAGYTTMLKEWSPPWLHDSFRDPEKANAFLRSPVGLQAVTFLYSRSASDKPSRTLSDDETIIFMQLHLFLNALNNKANDDNELERLVAQCTTPK